MAGVDDSLVEEGAADEWHFPASLADGSSQNPVLEEETKMAV
jgi:hypothetical protein